MRIPVNYLEWCQLFDEITQNPRDDSYIDTVSKGVISWTSGVAERFVQASSAMIRNRVNAAQDNYQKQMKNARGVSSNITNALSGLSKEYRYVYRLAKALPIPEEYRRQIVKSVVEQADQTQSSLEESAKADRTGHLSLLVKNAHVNKLD